MPNQLRIFILFIGTLILAGAFTFPLWRVVPEAETVSDELPGLNPALQPLFDELPRAIQTLYHFMSRENSPMAIRMVESRLVPPEVVIEPMPDVSNAQNVRNGRFQPLTLTDADRRANSDLELPPYNGLFDATGDLAVFAYPDNRYVFRLENFSVVNGPDLILILSVSSKPFTTEDFGRDYIEMGALRSSSGNMTYELRDININDYGSVVIYDRRYGMIYAFAPLG